MDDTSFLLFVLERCNRNHERVQEAKELVRILSPEQLTVIASLMNAARRAGIQELADSIVGQIERLQM